MVSGMLRESVRNTANKKITINYSAESSNNLVISQKMT